MKSKLTALYAASAAMILPAVAFAQTERGGGRIPNPLAKGKITSLEGIVGVVVNVVQILLIMATVLYLLYAGMMFVTARGAPDKLSKARNALLWGIVGAALILGAQVLVTTLKTSVQGILS